MKCILRKIYKILFEYLGRQFLDHILTPLKSERGFPIGATDDLSDVNTNFVSFQNTTNYPLPFFLPVWSWAKVAPKYARNRAEERKLKLWVKMSDINTYYGIDVCHKLMVVSTIGPHFTFPVQNFVHIQKLWTS